MDKTWIQAFGKMTYGIYVLTTFYEDQINAMIASWVSQVSFDPPLMMAAIHPSRYSHQLIEKSRCFALHIPAKSQREYLSRFKGPDPAAKFDGIQWIRGKSGCPILNQCVAYVECRVRKSYRPGNHALFIGEVIDARRCSDEEPFSSLDYEGQYLGKD
ncbi:MAG: flavin reductase family protein [Desulfobacterales bacterium]|jgi:flavin reductase (DIM6/NTAB) family NADH-FMN oxidoreductase RutF